MLLIDTQLLLWAAWGSDRLPDVARRRMANPDTVLIFSAASLWEIAIKAALGRPDFAVDPQALRRGLLGNGYRELTISGAHAVATVNLPPIHKDPFDRLLVAQAQIEGHPLLTADARLAEYGPAVQLV